MIKLVLQGSEYKIDLWRMLQVNAKTGFERQLSRQGPAVPKITAAAPLAASVPRSPAATTTQPLPLSAVRIPDHLPLPSCLRPAALLLGRLQFLECFTRTMQKLLISARSSGIPGSKLKLMLS